MDASDVKILIDKKIRDEITRIIDGLAKGAMVEEELKIRLNEICLGRILEYNDPRYLIIDLAGLREFFDIPDEYELNL